MASRREFLWRSALGLTAAAAWPLRLEARLDPHAPLATVPVLQVWTTETQAELKVLRPLSVNYVYLVYDIQNTRVPVAVLDSFTFAKAMAPFSVDHLSVTGLKPGAPYRLVIASGSKLVEERFFSTSALSKTSAKLALLSCSNDRYSGSQSAMWAAVDRARPDLLVFLGDAVYADNGSRGRGDGIWKRYCETWSRSDLYLFKNLIPTIAVWDDHDFGADNGDETFPAKADALKIFKAFYDSRSNDRLQAGPGVSSIAEAYGLRVCLMDNRTYRTPDHLAHGTHWGFEQEDWLSQTLKLTAKPTLLCNGNQFFGGYISKGSYEAAHPEALGRVLKDLSNSPSPVLFCSGDVHFSETMRLERSLLGYETFEITSSSLYSHTFPGHQNRARNPRRLDSTWKYNFILLETGVSGTELSFRARCLGESGELFQREGWLTRA